MTPRRRQVQERQIAGAMSELVLNPNFGKFIDLLREQREVVINDLCLESTVASERATLAAIGELRTYNPTIAAYDDHVARIEMENERQSEEAAP